MLQNTKELYGHKLAARDGEFGSVKDFFFDDKTWVIRYLVADTGQWLSGRQVLLSPHAFGSLDRNKKTLSVNLTRKQIEGSPAIDSHKPVSRQYEIDYYEYYGWPAYWTGGALWGLGGSPLIVPAPRDAGEADGRLHHRDDKHLRSAREVTGYAIRASDGEIGAVSGFIVDDNSWAVAGLAVEAGKWYSGKEILISTTQVERISYEDSKVFVRLTKSGIEQTAEHEVAKEGDPIGGAHGQVAETGGEDTRHDPLDQLVAADELTHAVPDMRDRVHARTKELALLAGRTPHDVSLEDYEQAKRELTGQSDTALQNAVLDAPAGTGPPHLEPSLAPVQPLLPANRLRRRVESFRIADVGAIESGRNRLPYRRMLS